jgi:succinate dehydrogenase/fumarate reductase flavoprotein subunit
MWEGCGVVRDRAGLLDASQRVEEIAAELETVSVPGPPEVNYAWQEALDLHNQLTVARALLAAALAREESRGAHFRADFPTADDEHWLRYVVVEQAGDGTLRIRDAPVEFSRAAPPAETRA